MLACLTGRDWLVAERLYGAGLRLMELARLRRKDIDLDLNTLTVRSGKGDRDRTMILAPGGIPPSQTWAHRGCRAKRWLGEDGGAP
jgi:site-specific recombinase XerC